MHTVFIHVYSCSSMLCTFCFCRVYVSGISSCPVHPVFFSLNKSVQFSSVQYFNNFGKTLLRSSLTQAFFSLGVIFAGFFAADFDSSTGKCRGHARADKGAVTSSKW